MKTSAAGRAAIRGREGVRLDAYKDSVGIWTIGVGHTGRASLPAVDMGMRITAEQADAFLAADLAPIEAAVAGAVPVPVSQNAFDAMVSLAFNIGAGAFRTSSVARLVNAGDLAEAADAFLLWDKAGGKVVDGLAKRRAAERAQFLTPDASAPLPLWAWLASVFGFRSTDLDA